MIYRKCYDNITYYRMTKSAPQELLPMD